MAVLEISAIRPSKASDLPSGGGASGSIRDAAQRAEVSVQVTGYLAAPARGCSAGSTSKHTGKATGVDGEVHRRGLFTFRPEMVRLPPAAGS